MISLEQIKIEAEDKLKGAQGVENLENLRLEYFGRKDGKLTSILKSLKDLPENERRTIGEQANKFRDYLQKAIDAKVEELKSAEQASRQEGEKIDITAPGKKLPVGHTHPLTSLIQKACDIFASMGFEIASGPEVEDEFHNFDALNVPKNHPARDMQDTFWLKDLSGFLLRTHTSSVQVRHMQKNFPPFRIVSPGRVFRNEATDATHEAQFYQFEGLMVDKDISLANLKAILEMFFQQLLGSKKIKIRFKPSFFPFVEPGLEVDVTCFKCFGKKCSTCKHTGWIELGGAGVVHPNVFKALKIDSKEWHGFAFGFGIDRIAMIKYGIEDVRLMYNGDMRFLQQFK